MVNAFAVAVAAIFRDPNMARDAIWRAGGTGAPVPVRVIRSQPDVAVGFGGATVLSDSVVLQLRVADVPDLAAGDTVMSEAVLYRVAGEPARDAHRLLWRAEARVEAGP